MPRVFQIVILLLLSAPAYSTPSLPADYGPYTFYNQQVYITNADNPAFSNPLLDHKDWAVTKIPSSWTVSPYKSYTGIAWYRIPLIFPGSLPDYTLGINLGKISDSDETYFNGVLIGRKGSMTDKQKIAYDIIRVYEIPTSLIRPGKTNVLSVRVRSLFPEEGGLLNGQFLIGRYADLVRSVFYEELARLFFVFSYVLIGLFFILFFLRRPTSLEYLLFGVFSLNLALYFFLRTQVKADMGLDLFIMKKMEYLSLCMAFPLFLWFIKVYFKLKTAWFPAVITAVFGIGFTAVLFTPGPVYWDIINTRFLQIFWLIEIIGIIIILVRRYKRSKDARIILIAFIVFSFSVVWDLLSVRNIIILPIISMLGLLAPYGFSIFVGSIALVLSNGFVRLYKEVEVKTFNLLETLSERDEAYEKVDKAYLEAMNRLAIIAEMRDPETGAHIRRVSYYVRILAERSGYNHETVDNLFYAAPMHDVGKVGIPDHILFKESPLNTEEWDIMKTHTLIGARIFENAESAVLKIARDIALTHHEKWSGGGYPNGLSGTQIPISGRMMAIADVYDALRSRRPYKEPFTHTESVRIITEGDNRVKPLDFDPELLKIFKAHAELFDIVYRENMDETE